MNLFYFHRCFLSFYFYVAKIDNCLGLCNTEKCVFLNHAIAAVSSVQINRMNQTVQVHPINQPRQMVARLGGVDDALHMMPDASTFEG
jgi:hypothetical protein